MRLRLMIEGQEDVTWEDWLALARACERHGIEALFRSDHYLSVADDREKGAEHRKRYQANIRKRPFYVLHLLLGLKVVTAASAFCKSDLRPEPYRYQTYMPADPHTGQPARKPAMKCNMDPPRSASPIHLRRA